MKLNISYSLNKKEISEELDITEEVGKVIKSGMSDAAKVDNRWKENAEDIVTEFWGEVSYKGLAKGQIASTLRGKNENDEEKSYLRAFAVFTQMHPQYKEVLINRAKLEAMVKGSTDYEAVKHVVNGFLSTCRAVASAQLRTVIKHFAAQVVGDASSDEARESKGAIALIEEVIVDWNSKVIGERGPFAVMADRAILAGAVDALRTYLAKARREANPVLNLAEPRHHGSRDRAAGKVSDITEQYIKENGETPILEEASM